MSWVAIGWGAGTIISGVVTSSMQDKSNKAAQQSQQKASNRQMWQQRQWNLADYERLMEDWRKNAFPNEMAMQAARQGGRQQLGQAFKGLPEKVFSQSASRGFGPGSGLTMKSLGDVEGSYMNAMSQMMTKLAQFQNTAQFGPPGSISQTGQLPIVPQTGGQMWGNLGNDLGTMGGYAMTGGFGNFQQQPMPGYSTPFGAQFGVANPKYGW